MEQMRQSLNQQKADLADSMKRCAVQWGLGRDLYEYPMVQIEGEYKYIPHHLMERLDKMIEAINNGEFKKNYVLLKEKYESNKRN
jgi:hypothetical protein